MFNCVCVRARTHKHIPYGHIDAGVCGGQRCQISPRARVIVSCKLPDVGAGNQTPALCQGIICC